MNFHGAKSHNDEKEVPSYSLTNGAGGQQRI